MVKQFSAVSATHLCFQREVTQELNDLRHMVIIFGEEFSLTVRVKEEVGRQEFEDYTGDAPYIGPCVPVAPADDDLRSAVLACLNVLGKMFLGRCCVAKICNLDRNQRRIRRG